MQTGNTINIDMKNCRRRETQRSKKLLMGVPELTTVYTQKNQFVVVVIVMLLGKTFYMSFFWQAERKMC